MKAGGPQTEGGGLTLYNGKSFKSFDLTQFSSLDIRTTNINCIKEFRGNLWIGTQGGGLLKYDGSKFSIFRKSDSLPQILLMIFMKIMEAFGYVQMVDSQILRTKVFN